MSVAADDLAARYRVATLDVANRAVRLSRLAGSAQEADITMPLNCSGFGRVHHFRVSRSSRWVENPLPISPAARALKLDPAKELRAQVFQNAACNLRCWYCFVPFSLLEADAKRSAFVPVQDMVRMYLSLLDRPAVLDLSGGQPDLTPEWVAWTLIELERVGASDVTYVWSDDNLSTEYVFTKLSRSQLRTMQGFRNYGRVGCFKGFDERSFAFNTGASPSLFARQFSTFRRLLELGLDCFAYVTLTCDAIESEVARRISAFMDALQRIHPLLPLRTIPLEVQPFSVTAQRRRIGAELALENQYRVLEVWGEELNRRFTAAERAWDVCDVSLQHRGGSRSKELRIEER